MCQYPSESAIARVDRRKESRRKSKRNARWYFRSMDLYHLAFSLSECPPSRFAFRQDAKSARISSSLNPRLRSWRSFSALRSRSCLTAMRAASDLDFAPSARIASSASFRSISTLVVLPTAEPPHSVYRRKPRKIHPLFPSRVPRRNLLGRDKASAHSITFTLSLRSSSVVAYRSTAHLSNSWSFDRTTALKREPRPSLRPKNWAKGRGTGSPSPAVAGLPFPEMRRLDAEGT